MTLPQGRVSTPSWALYQSEYLQAPDRRTLGGSYANMLLDDLSKRHHGFECRLAYDGVTWEQGEAFLADLLTELSMYGRDRAERLFWRLVETVIYEQTPAGRCTAELYVASEDGDEGPPHPRLGILPSWSLEVRRGRLRQLDPAGIGQWRDLTSATVIAFDLDPALQRAFTVARRDLALMDTRSWGRDGLIFRPGLGYDLQLHRRELEQLAARATSSIGWNGRGSYMERATDSLKVYRELKFVRTWLGIVDGVLQTLNRSLTLWEPSTCPARIRVDGLPSVQDIEAGMEAVIAGSEPLDQLRTRVDASSSHQLTRDSE